MEKEKIVSVVKVGRCTDGFQRDHGAVRHAMLKDQYCWGTHAKALCGTQPGRRSVGFVGDEGQTAITCPRCAKKAVNYQVVDVETGAPATLDDLLD